MSALQSDIEAMQAKLAATLARFQDAREDCAAIETEVVDEVCMQPTDPTTPPLVTIPEADRYLKFTRKFELSVPHLAAILNGLLSNHS